MITSLIREDGLVYRFIQNHINSTNVQVPISDPVNCLSIYWYTREPTYLPSREDYRIIGNEILLEYLKIRPNL